ncbi:MAG: PilZ domain-containing protein [Candidatus Hydrogenedentes bacterium]|nr:PilZ domain-containing protein [Candidatus Hydrogenedentota bacterium]
MSGLRTGFDDARSFARVAFGGRLSYWHGAGNPGTAIAADVSRGGLRLHMGRYLRPGTHVLLNTDEVRSAGKPVELKGQIVWCNPEKRGQRFVAGVRVIYDEPDAITTISTLVTHAIAASGVLDMPQPSGNPVRAAWTIRPFTAAIPGRAGADVLAGNV